ncbi:hypothetical protein [Pseudoalteromonas sp. MTN2-4]|uniref:hypothetical protein n=1 Tax=Pseudoalteromonas sp. MTN2-4 TaxID=3056555 RepID=UPI0036F36C44
MKDFFLDYVIFGGEFTLLSGLWNTLSFSENSSWEVIFAGFLTGFIFKKFHKKEWGKSIANVGFLTIPALIISLLIFVLPNKTEGDKKYYYSLVDSGKKMDADYRQWRDKNPLGVLNPEWQKERDLLSKEQKKEKEKIITKLTNQAFFFLFLLWGFFYKTSSLKEGLSDIKNEIQTLLREKKERKERAQQEAENEKLRMKRLEEKAINLEIEKERTKQAQAESAVKLKKLDVERPEKEKNLSKIIDKLDGL